MQRLNWIWDKIKLVLKRMWSKKWFLLPIAVVLLVGAYRGYKKYLKPKADNSFVSHDYLVATGDISNSLTLMGTTNFANAQKLTFVEKGKVVAVNVKVGDLVKKGQVLASMSADVLDKKIEKAKKDLEKERKKLREALNLSSRELDILTAQSEYEIALLEQKNLPITQQLALQSQIAQLKEQELKIKEKEVEIRNKEKEYQEAQEEYALFKAGKQGFDENDLLVSETLTKRYDGLKEIITEFKTQSELLKTHLDAYDKVVRLRDEDWPVIEDPLNIYIGAKNFQLLSETKSAFWTLDNYREQLKEKYDSYMAMPFSAINEDKLLEDLTLIKQSASALKARGKLNYKMAFETKEHENYGRTQIKELAETIGTAVEKAGEDMHNTYTSTLKKMRSLRKEDTSIETLAIKLEKTKLQRDNAKTELEVAKANYETAKVKLESFRKEQVLSGAAFTRNILNKKEKLDALINEGEESDALQNAKAAVDDAQITLTSLMKEYENYRLVANFDGVVTKLDMQVGDSISSSDSEQKYIYVETPNLLEVKLDVDQIDIVKIQLGMTVEVAVDALPDARFEGKFSEIDTMSDGNSYKAKVVFEKQDESQKILWWMSASVRVVLEEENDVILVPNPALADNENGEKIVRLQKDGTWIDQVVEIGMSDDMNTVITAGLEVWDIIKGLYINDVSIQNMGIGQDEEEFMY